MRRLLLSAILVFSITAAAEPIPPEWVGIWATEGSEFRGAALMKGQAFYIDNDGNGGFVGGDGRAVIGVRMVVTSYHPGTNQLGIDFTENGKVIASGTLTYDPFQYVIYSAKDPQQRYQRRASSISPEMRKTLGHEPRIP